MSGDEFRRGLPEKGWARVGKLQTVTADCRRVHVGFTGTQMGWSHQQRLAATKKLSDLRLTGAVWLHVGDCVGSDLQAAIQWRAERGLIHLHPPDKSRKRAFIVADASEEPKPYLVRNGDIVAACDMLVATPSTMTEQQRSGTWSTIRRARKLHRTIWIVWPDGTETLEPAA